MNLWSVIYNPGIRTEGQTILQILCRDDEITIFLHKLSKYHICSERPVVQHGMFSNHIGANCSAWSVQHAFNTSPQNQIMQSSLIKNPHLLDKNSTSSLKLEVKLGDKLPGGNLIH